MGRSHFLNIFQSYFVIAIDNRFLSQFSQVLIEVI